MDEIQYHKTEIQRIFNLIARYSISPQERARMKDEYSLELLQQEKSEKVCLAEKQEIARNLLAEGLDPAIVAKTTGLSPDELAALSS